MSTDNHYLKTIRETVDFIAADMGRARSLNDSLFARAQAIDPKIGAYCSLDKQSFDQQAPALHQKAPFFGLPVSLKDNMCTRGWETTCGSNILAGFIPPYDASVVSKLNCAGAYIFAKCDMDEFAFGSSCESSAYNARSIHKKKHKDGPCVNPWFLGRVPGGSSGGSAACVAADEAICALGSDTGGSIRQPAALCGVVGLKPTYGRVSRYGLIAFGSSLDQIGPITKTVEDAALLLGIIAGHDEKDSTSADVRVPDYLASLGRDLKGLKIGIPKEYFIDGIDPEVRSRIDEAIATYKELGATCVPISLPHTKYAVSVYYIIATAEASSNLARFDGVQYGYRAEEALLRDMYFETRNRGFGAEAKRRILLGTFVLSSGYYDAYYKKAQKVRTLMVNDFNGAFEACDVILTPTSPTAAFKLGEKCDDPISMYLSDIFTIPANLAGIPGISVPAGFTKDGLPVGMQLLAPAFKEETLFRFAHAFEQKTEFYKYRPNL
jgi:aspartyl-tRNA(Asn)/glutamyl-tRNA(Gln) amidotransferase subunit A